MKQLHCDKATILNQAKKKTKGIFYNSPEFNSGFLINFVFLRVPTACLTVSKARSVRDFQSQIFQTMPQSLAKIYLHIVFSTKNRIPMIAEEIRLNAQAYFVKVGAGLSSFTEEIFMMPDHIHWLCTLPRTITIADLVKNVKISSSIKFKELIHHNFEWQKGYGVFSVSQSKLDTVKRYIQNQKEHHEKTDFQTEYRSFLEEYRIEYDEKYVWD